MATHAHRHARIETPIGELWVSVSRRGLVAISRHPPPGGTLDPEALAEVADQLAGYFAGRRREFDVRLDVRDAAAFDATVWTAARLIPYGATASYGELAIMAGRPGAGRAVGGAMARCPFTPVVPCHRVIHADGTLGGWGSESWVKRWLLAHEGVRPPPT